MGNLGAIRSDDFVRRRDEESERKAEALKSDEYEIRGVPNTTTLSRVNVERKLDRRTNELTEFSQTQPDSSYNS
jgi:hypothetical protein